MQPTKYKMYKIYKKYRDITCITIILMYRIGWTNFYYRPALVSSEDPSGGDQAARKRSRCCP